MIEKPTIIVTSLGRTGTRFFANLFAGILPDSTSLHEPDVLGFFPYSGKKRWDEFTRGLRISGVYNMTIGKLRGAWSLVRVSDARVQSEISEAEAVRRVREQRHSFVHKQPGTLYVESSLGFYGLIDILPKVFKNHRAVYIVRDGRDWIRSKLAWGEMYNLGTWRRALGDHVWPSADQFEDDPFREDWARMSRFERLCWAWWRLNEYAMNTLCANPNARLFRFEDLFDPERRKDKLEELLEFCAEVSPEVDLVTDGIEQFFQRKVHASNGSVPAWDEWAASQREQFESLCGPLMAELNY